MFLVLALVSLFVRSLLPVGTGGEMVFFIFTIIFISVFVGSLFITTINHFIKGESIVQSIEEIRTMENKIALRESKKEELTNYMNEQVLNVFPKFEEKILSVLGPGNNKELLALFQKYPELQSSKHLSKLVSDVTGLVTDIYRVKEKLEMKKEEIRTYLRNPWFLAKVKVSDEIMRKIV